MNQMNWNMRLMEAGELSRSRNPLEQGPIPLYYQLGQRLRERIKAQEFAAGAALPTEDQLCCEYAVSRITVRRALDGLQKEGLIQRRRGIGSFVSDRPRGINSRLTGSLDEFLATAGSLNTRCISIETTVPPAEIRLGLGLRSGDMATLLVTVGSFNGEPAAYLEIWFPDDIGRQLQSRSLNGHVPVVRLVEQIANVRITRAEQTIEPDRAGEAAARLLHVSSEAPVLHVKRVYFAGDRPIEMANVRYHPDRYRYAIEFRS